jgi:Domain of unknown function (DUF4438)
VRTNADSLVEIAVHGEVWPPAAARDPYKATSEGRAAVTLGMSGIAFQNRVGDPAFGWEADHLEPGVSIRHPNDGPEHALHYLACIGNDAVVTSGASAGARGVVTGEHAHVMVDFPPESIELLGVGDRIQIKAIGTGLKLLEHPDVQLHKCSPRLLEALRLESLPDGRLQVPVVSEIPSYLMGSGAELMADYVDQDFMTGDRDEIARLGLDQLRLGDIVVVPNQDHTWGRGYYSGAVTIGLIIHGDSAWTGHGPGVLDLMSSRTDAIATVADPDANIAWRLGLRDRAREEITRPGAISSYAVNR